MYLRRTTRFAMAGAQDTCKEKAKANKLAKEPEHFSSHQQGGGGINERLKTVRESDLHVRKMTPNER